MSTLLDVAILLGIVGLSGLGTVALITYTHWLQRLGGARIGMAFTDATRADAHDVADTEAELLGDEYDLGRTRSRTLAEKLAAYRNEIAA